MTLLNFGMTPEGLERHLTAVVAANENPELKQRKDMLVDWAKKELQLAEIDDKILNMLSKSEVCTLVYCMYEILRPPVVIKIGRVLI